MRGNEKQFKDTRLIIVLLSVIIILLLGVITLLLAKDNKQSTILEPNKVDKKEEQRKEDIVEEPKEEKEEEQAKKKTTEENNKAESKYIDVSNECFNSGKCTKEFELSNGEKNIKIKIMSNGSEIYIYKDGSDIKYFAIQDPNWGEYKVNKIALLDTNHLVIELKSFAGIERDYFDSRDSLILQAWEIAYDNNYRFNTEITDKVIYYYRSELGCDAEGRNRTSYKYKFTIKDENNYNSEYVESIKTVCAGQS